MRGLLMVREVVGWLLLVGGVLVFGLALLLLMDQRLFEAVPAVAVGFVIFRGGIHLLKSALALRVVLQGTASPTPPRQRSPVGGPWATIPSSSGAVLPRPEGATVAKR
jgi:hypothetical protein